jgi:GNAT superfamily N-acetyltransferase
MDRFSHTPLSLLRFQKTFEPDVCNLVQDEKTLGLIAEEKAGRLTPSILGQWIARAEDAFVLMVDSELAGFGTIGCKEWDFPKGFCEVGHLIIKADRRRRGYGSILLLCLLDEIRKRGFKFAAGRVCVGNEPARLLLKKQGWHKTNRPEFIHDNRFEWFYRECQVKKEQNLPSH